LLHVAGDIQDHLVILLRATVIVPPAVSFFGLGAGGGYDTYARLLAPYIEKYLGCTIVVDNVTGAGGDVGRNKLWNASRFVVRSIESTGKVDRTITPGRLLVEDRWILSRLTDTIAETTKSLREFKYSEPLAGLYRFFWNDFCDWYLEWAKPRLQDENKRLDRAREQAQEHDRERSQKREHIAVERADDKLFCEDVSEQTHAQRERPGTVADDFNREKKPGQPPDYKPDPVFEYRMFHIMNQLIAFDLTTPKTTAPFSTS
jgi:hypothetical protein